MIVFRSTRSDWVSLQEKLASSLIKPAVFLDDKRVFKETVFISKTIIEISSVINAFYYHEDEVDYQLHLIERSLQNYGTILVTDDPKMYKRSILYPRFFFYYIENELIKSKGQLNAIKNSHDEMLSIWSRLKELESCGSIRIKPLIMLVGDSYSSSIKIGEKSGTRCFIHHTGCAAYLHQALELTSFKKNFYLTNYNKFNEKEKNIIAINYELRVVKPDLIIALGREASIELLNLKINHQMIVHPQYYYRFYHQQVKEYAEIIDFTIIDTLK